MRNGNTFLKVGDIGGLYEEFRSADFNAKHEPKTQMERFIFDEDWKNITQTEQQRSS